MAVTNAVSWRSEGLKYRKNEVFLDVVESVNLLVSASGNVLRSEIVGAIKMRVYLSGMPELRLGLNDKVCISFSINDNCVYNGRDTRVMISVCTMEEIPEHTGYLFPSKL